MLTEISYFIIFGRPLIMYLGIVTLLMFLVTASVAILNMKGIDTIPLVWHPRFAVLSICLALAHGMLGILCVFLKNRKKNDVYAGQKATQRV